MNTSSISRRVRPRGGRGPAAAGGGPGGGTAAAAAPKRGARPPAPRPALRRPRPPPERAAAPLGAPPRRGALQLVATALDPLLERAARLVGARAGRAALVRRQLSDPAQDGRQLRLAAEETNPRLLEGRGIGGGVDGGLRLGANLGDAGEGVGARHICFALRHSVTALLLRLRAHGRVILFPSS